jgi:hypothetical protein
MNIERRVELLEKEVMADATSEDEIGWREKEAQRLVPMLREIARCVQWENTPLPSDEEILRRARASISHWSSQKAYREWQNDPRTAAAVSDIKTFCPVP